MSEVRTMKVIALVFMAIFGFFGLVGMALSYLNRNWFGMVFGTLIAAIAVVGVALIAVAVKPQKEKEDSAKEPGGE